MKDLDPATEERESEIAIHIFTVSAGLVGVCLTVISITRSLAGGKTIHRLVDDLLAVNAMVFMASCALSYWALRSRGKRRMRRLETIADVFFLIGLLGLVLACALIVWAVVE